MFNKRVGTSFKNLIAGETKTNFSCRGKMMKKKKKKRAGGRNKNKNIVNLQLKLYELPSLFPC